MILAKATWTEVEALDREQVVVVPVGGTEPQGPSLPMGTSTYIAQAIAYGLHFERGDEVVVVPASHYGVSGADKSFAGTIDLGYEALVVTLRAIVRSMARHRFRRFLLVSGGFGDTAAAVAIAARALKDELPTVQFATWEISPASASIEDFQNRGSLLLATHPDLVRPSGSEIARSLDLEDGDELAPHFVSDRDETSIGGWPAIADREPSVSRAYLDAQLRAAGELVARMREGRIYVERDRAEETAQSKKRVAE